MTVGPDPRIDEAKAIPLRDVVERLGITRLRHGSGELVGPCPLCGGRDRFAVNLTSRAFLCRKCGIKGGDTIALTQQVLNLSFPDALQFLCGDKPADLDPQEVARRRALADAAERKDREEAERYRRRAIADAQEIWARSRPGHLGVVRAYLLARGITPAMLPELPVALRFILDHPYTKKIDGQRVTPHRGPCVIAGVLAPDGRILAVHQTWVDPEPPHGKAPIAWQGAALPAKLVRGSKKGGAIRLITPPDATTLVMGEGIETTLSAFAAQPVPGAAYWAGVDLGNMGGKAAQVPGQRWHGVPDMQDSDAFLPPPWVKRLIFLQDGDSHPKATRHKLECGLRRAMLRRPGLKGQIVHPGAAVDFNDVLTGRALAGEDADSAARMLDCHGL